MATNRFKLSLPYQALPQLVITPALLLERHLWGIPTCNNGVELPSSVIRQKILDAQLDVENYFAIKLFPQLIRENVTYYPEEFNNYGFVRVSYNIQRPLELQGFYGQGKQVEFSRDWLSTRQESTSRPGASGTPVGFRHMYVIPNGGSATSTSGTVYSGPFAAYTFRNSGPTPNYWQATYVTGFEVIPADLVNLVEKLAAIQVLAQLGDSFLAPGISSQSISLDGLSQTMSTIRNAQGGVYAPRIIQYGKDIAERLDILRGKYRGILFDMM
jgi:hypothetical protein